MKNLRSTTGGCLCLLLLIISLMAIRAEAAENILTNPGFESGTTGWSGFGCSFTTSTSIRRSGIRSGRAYNRSGDWSGIKQSLVGKMEDGETYFLSGWIRLSGAASDEVKMTIKQTDGDGTHYHSISSSIGYDDSWTNLSGGFTLNVTGSLTTLDLYFEGPAPSVSYYLDDTEALAPEPNIPTDPNATGIVDVDIVYQELEGFGASGGWYENWLTAHPLKNQLYDILFGDLGLDIYRLRNTYDQGSDGALYIDRSAQIVAAAEDSLGHPIKIMISCWSPPIELKSDANLAGGTLKKDAYGDYMYDEFAEWWADSLDDFSSHGIDADYISIQNEPDWVTAWDTCKFTPIETDDWAGYNLAFEAVYQELDSRMPELPKILGPEACGCGGSQAYIEALIDANHMYGFAHHHYSDSGYDFPDSFIPIMENFSTNYGYKPLFQTEYSRGEGEEPFSVALNLARHMHNSLVHEGTCSFLYWDLFWGVGDEGEKGGLVTLDNPWSGNPSYTINHTYYAFKQYSAFTDPGWHRVETSTDSNGLRISAFKSPDGTELSIVIINTSEIDVNLALSLGDYSPDSSSVYRTSETEGSAYVGTFNESQPLSLLAESITTISLTGPTDFSNCAEVQAGGYGLSSDISGDCYVNHKDLNIITDFWLTTGCGGLDNCDGADFEPDDDVDFFDLSTFTLQWGQCNNPEDPNCTPNW